MSKLKDYPYDDQLFYIEKFIEYCNKVCTKFEEEKPQIKAESYLLNQIKFID